MKKHLFILLFTVVALPLFTQTSLKVGDIAPEITLKDKSGDVIKLSEHTGSLTIVHFWASWSKACKPMNQFLSQNYSKYNKEGLEIFSISIDKKGRTWLEEIHKQKLNWPHHVSDFKGMVYSKPAKDYKIYEVPSIFLLDENGVIIMINPSQDELSKRLKLLESELKVLPKASSNYIFLTKRADYLIYDANDTLVMGGKGKSVFIMSLDTGYYRMEIQGKSINFKKINQDKLYDFQINYKTKQVTFLSVCTYEIRSKNGNLLLSGKGDYIDYSVLNINNKDDFYLILPNSAHSVKLY
jgi:peroxiredoxin